MPIVISGTNGISGVDGTASNPSYEGTDANTGVFFPAADTVAIGTNGTEALRVDSSRNVGVGITPAAWGQAGTVSALQIKSTSLAGSGTNAYWGSNWYGGGFDRYIETAAASLYVQTGGQHVWYTAPSGTAGNSISFTQSLQLARGSSLALEGATSQTGTGITFPATQSASSNANTLDDYEEGTWTPTIISVGGGSPTYNTRDGRYTKIGRVVTASFYIDFGVGTLAAGGLSLSNLPFACGFNYEYGFARFNASGAVAAPANGLVGLQLQNGSAAAQIQIGTATGITSWTQATLDNGQDILGTITYTV